MRTTLLPIVFLLAVAAARSAAAIVVVIPPELDLGTIEPATVVSSSVWLVNTGVDPVELLTAKGSCGCTVLDFEPQVLAWHQAVRVPVRVTAPNIAGKSSSVTVTFTLRDREPITLPVRLVTAGDLDAATDVLADPPVIELCSVTPGSLVSTSVRLVNTGDIPHRVTIVRPSCSCMTVRGFTPTTIAPGEAFDVHLDVETPSTLGATSHDLTFVLEGRRALTVPVRMKTTDARAEKFQQHLDGLYPGRYSLRNVVIEDDILTAVAFEVADRRPSAWVTCRFNDDGTVDSLLLEPIRS